MLSYRAKGLQRLHTVGRNGERTVQQKRELARDALLRVRRRKDPSRGRLALRAASIMADSSSQNSEFYWD